MNQTLRNAFTDKFLLTPLEALYGTLPAVKKSFYHDALKSYVDSELKLVFLYLRDNYPYQRFPSIADIQQARKKCAEERPISSSIATKQEFPWEIRNRKIIADQVEYCINYQKTSQTMREAEAEGWDWELIKYVREVAYAQAQAMHGFIRSVDWARIQPDDLEKDALYAWRKRFLDDCRRIVGYGGIDVAIPTAKIALWKSMAANKRDTQHPIMDKVYGKSIAGALGVAA